MKTKLPFIDLKSDEIAAYNPEIIYDDELQFVLLNDFVKDQEIESIIPLGKDRFKRARIIETDRLVESPRRTNWQCQVFNDDNEHVSNLNKRIERICNWSDDRTEDLVLNRYEEGQLFWTHNDFVDDEKRIGESGHRLASMIIYLNDDFEGGKTIFPKLKKIFTPKKGCALFYNYHCFEHPKSYDLLHSGGSVRNGTKYILTKWFNEKFKTHYL